MEERGLVERVRVPDDRRIVLVRPTQTGLDLVDEVELVKSDVLAAALARLTPQSLDRLAAAAADLRAALEPSWPARRTATQPSPTAPTPTATSQPAPASRRVTRPGPPAPDERNPTWKPCP